MIERENDPNSPSALAAQKTPEEIQEDVRRARSVIKEDIKELGERFKPEHLKQNALDAIHNAKDQAFEAVSQRGRRVAGAAKDVVSENGAPLLLIGLGAGWLMMSQARKRRAQQQGWYEPSRTMAYESGGYRGAFQGAGYRSDYPGNYETAGSAGYASGPYSSDAGYTERSEPYVTEGTYEREGAWSGARLTEEEHGPSRTQRFKNELGRYKQELGRYKDQVSDKSSHMVQVSRERMVRARDRTRDFAVENPFAFGAALLAAGVGVGMLLPETRRENRLLGPTRDRLLGQARGIAQEMRSTASQLGQTTRSVATEVKDALTERNAPH